MEAAEIKAAISKVPYPDLLCVGCDDRNDAIDFFSFSFRYVSVTQHGADHRAPRKAGSTKYIMYVVPKYP